MSIKLKNKKNTSDDTEVKKKSENQDYQFFYFEGRYLNFNNIISIRKDRDYDKFYIITYAHPQLDYGHDIDGFRIYKTSYESFTISTTNFEKILKPYLDSKTLRISK